MAYSVKFRSEFVDFYSRAVKVDISQEDWSGAVTTITPSYPSLSIEWPSKRGDIFDPVRGAMAKFNVYASTNSQFDEFFDAYETEYKMEIYISSALYWTGWIMVGDHQEAFNSAPYIVSFRAYDLGYLQDIEYDDALEDDDSIIDVIQECLSKTGFSFDLKERVNIYEDSINSTQSDSMLNQINVHQAGFFDADWVGLSCYDILSRELMPFNAFIMQENGVWNVCRVGDMIASHNYRVFNTSGAVTSSGAEDTTKTLTDYSIIDNSGILLAADSWKNLNLYQDYGIKNLVNNGRFDKDISISDFWTESGTGGTTQIEPLTFNTKFLDGELTGNNFLLMGSTTGTVGMTHDLTYAVESANTVRLKVRYRLGFYQLGGSVSTLKAQFFVTNTVGVTSHLLQTDGSWVNATTDTNDIPITNRGIIEGEIVSEEFDGTGTLSFAIRDVAGVTGASIYFTYWDYFEVTAIVGASSTIREDYSEVIDVNNLTDPSEVVIYHGDSEYTATGRDVLLGSYATTGGSTTDAWRSAYGSAEDKVVQICANNYKAQYTTTARRLQATIKGQINYLDVFENGGKSYIPSSLTYNIDDSEWQGERIEHKQLWEEVPATFANGVGAANLYDSFSTSTNFFDPEKTQTATVAQSTITVTTEVGQRYKLNINIADLALVGTSDIPEFTFCGVTKSDFVLGDNEWEFVALSTQGSSDVFVESAVADTCDLSIHIFIYEIIGG